MVKTLPPITVLSTADFNSDVWTNKQYIAAGFAKWGRVDFIESLGLRQPRINRTDVRRMLTRLIGHKDDDPCNEMNLSTKQRENLHILSPSVLPLHKYRFVRFVNRLLLDALYTKEHYVIDGRRVLWTFSPLTYGLERYADIVIYHSVDLLHKQPGVPSRVLLDAEKTLLKKADVVIASSQGVARHLRSMGRCDVQVWENVADTELYSEFVKQVKDRLPRVIFAGNLSPVKVNICILEELAESNIDVALAGPIGIDGINVAPKLRALLGHRNIHYLGNLTPRRLAYEMAKSMVGVIPYNLNELTKGIFPMKVFEYLSSGLSVVSTPLPSLLSSEQVCGLRIVRDEEFVRAVRTEIDNFDERKSELRIEAAKEHSWTGRINDAIGLIYTLTGQPV